MGKVIITYDKSNKEELKLVEDYFFLKYYITTLVYDYEHLLEDYNNKIIYNDILSSVLNRIEWCRLKDILQGDYTNCFCCTLTLAYYDDNQLFHWVIYCGSIFIKRYKDLLISKLKNNKK